MYQFTGKLKIFALALMVVGLLGTVYNFMSAPSTLEEAKEILAKEAAAAHHGGHHGEAGSHGEEAHHDGNAHSESLKEEHKSAEHGNAESADHSEAATTEHKEEVHSAEAHTEKVDSTHVVADATHETKEEAHKEENHAEAPVAHHNNVNGDHHGDHHAEHAFHQMQNRPWSAFYVAMLFSLGVSLLVFCLLYTSPSPRDS